MRGSAQDDPWLLERQGIYAISCDITGECYVGYSIRSFNDRWRDHIDALLFGAHPCALLQERWDEYGPTAFSFSVLSVPDWLSPGARRDYMHLESLYIRTAQNQRCCLNTQPRRRGPTRKGEQNERPA